MKKLLSFSLLALMCASVFAQQVVLTFTGRDADNHFLPLSRVVIGNQTRGWQETICYPDTTLSFGATGIEENASDGSFGLAQNNPNPFNGATDVNLTVTEPGAVTMEIADVNGKIVETYGRASLPTKNGEKGHTDNPFSIGDEMVYIGYAIVNGTEYASQTIHQNQLVSETFVLNFNVAYSTYGQPCPGAPTLTDVDGNTYNTVQIGNQCWMKENLRTKKYADGTSISQGSTTSTTTGYWYYPNNSSSNQSTYGLLYNWKAVMRNSSSSTSNPSNVQGICPTGWHVPSDAEWTQLTSYVKSQSAYVCAGCSDTDDEWCIDKALASTIGWNSSTGTCAVGSTPNSNNATGFSALPAGNYSGSFNYSGSTADFWSATSYSTNGAWSRHFITDTEGVYSYDYYNKYIGFSVRCLRD